MRLHEAKGAEAAKRDIVSLFESGDLKAQDFDLGRLFEACFGWNNFRAVRADRSILATQIMEAAGGVSTDAFKNISGQIVYNETLQGYDDEEFTFKKLIPEKQSPYTFEKIAGIPAIGDEVVTRAESEPYSFAGLTQNWIHGPETQSRGLIVPVTREAIFFDRTGQLLTQARDVGRSLGYNREKRAVDCVIDENAGAVSAALGGHRYHWLDTSIATYGDNSGTHTWDNLAGANGALADWTDVDAMEQLLNQMTDPFTGEPIMFMGRHLVVAKELEKTALRIREATTLKVVTPGYATSGNPTVTEAPNPYAGQFEVVSSRYVAFRMAMDTNYFYGDLTRAFQYFVNFPFQTIQAPSNSHDEFHRDIVMQFRADERGNYGTKEPRAMIKATVA